MTRLGVLRRQFDLTWALAEYHLDRVTTAALLWEPATPCWTVREDAAGRWRPDWEVPEPDPVPAPTGAWISWHLGWWWTTTTAHLGGRAVPAREEITWPGTSAGTVAWLHDLHDDWVDLLAGLDEAALDEQAPFPWPPGSDRTVADTVAWVNVELMKNVAELGQLLVIGQGRLR